MSLRAHGKSCKNRLAGERMSRSMKLNTDLCLVKNKKIPWYHLQYTSCDLVYKAPCSSRNGIVHHSFNLIFCFLFDMFLFVLIQATYVLRLSTGATYSVITYNFIS